MILWMPSSVIALSVTLVWGALTHWWLAMTFSKMKYSHYKAIATSQLPAWGLVYRSEHLALSHSHQSFCASLFSSLKWGCSHYLPLGWRSALNGFSYIWVLLYKCWPLLKWFFCLLVMGLAMRRRFPPLSFMVIYSKESDTHLLSLTMLG